MKELEEFLSTLSNLVKVNGGYKFVYNGINCYGQIVNLHNTLELVIKPINASNKISNYSGESIFKTFKKDLPEKIPLKELSPKDIAIGFAEFCGSSFGEYHENIKLWQDCLDETYTYTTEQLFNEYLNTL